MKRTRSRRRRSVFSAVHKLAGRARHVVLLTATPHAGDNAAYAALCAVGQLEKDDPVALFRRTRSDVGLGGTRHVHLLSVRLSRDEREMHRLLAAYTRRVWHAGAASDQPEGKLVATIF